MDCTTHRELLSAGLDAEATPLEQAAADRHVATCTACAAWFSSAAAVTRAARLGPAEPVPDLTAAILARSPVVPAPDGPPRTLSTRRDDDSSSRQSSVSGEERTDGLPVARIGLALVAVAQVLVSQDGLFDATHLGREQGVWELALAIGFATAAWQPRRAAGLVPLVGALVIGLLVTASLDAAEGSVGVLAEGHHLLPIVGLVLLVVSTRLSSPVRRLVLG